MSIYGKDKTNLFLGYFTNLAEIQAQYPTGEDGQYAGANDVKKMYYWDVSARAWTDSGDVYTGVLDAGDLQLGAVELKDGTTDARATVNAANTARTTATTVVAVQPIDETGAIIKGGGASLNAEYMSPTDFTVTYTSASTVTISGLPYTLGNSPMIKGILVTNTSTNVSVLYNNGVGGYSFAHSSGVVTAYLNGVAASIFTSNDTYVMGLDGQEKAYDSSLDIQKTVNQSPDRLAYVADSLLDTTNVAAATNYYPSSTGISNDGYSDVSLSGQFIDADGTMTLSVQVTNDEDTTNANWQTVYGYDDINNTNANSWTVTNGTLNFAISFTNMNYSYFRVVMVNSGATNTAIIKLRRKAL